MKNKNLPRQYGPQKLLLLPSEEFLIEGITTALPACPAQGLKKPGCFWAFYCLPTQIKHGFNENE